MELSFDEIKDNVGNLSYEELATKAGELLLKKGVKKGVKKLVGKGYSAGAGAIIGQEICSIISKHAKYVGLAGTADGVPIPGSSTVSVGVVVASTWKMYYDLSKYMELPFSDNFIKSIGSGIVSNITSNGISLGLHGFSELANKVPVIGNILAAGTGAAANYVAITAAAAMYLSAITLLLDKGDLDENSIRLEGRKTKNANCRTLPFITVGVLGHVDHGKTTLVTALSQVLAQNGINSMDTCTFNDLDNTKEEHDRQVTINSSVFGCETKNHHMTLIDCPGHADYVNNMVESAYNMDGAIVVVSATDGPMPQTREHILLAKQNGIKRLVVYINKCDQIHEEEMLDLCEMDMLDILEKFGYSADTPIIRGSAYGALNGNPKWTNSVMELANVLDDWFQVSADKRNEPFMLNVHKIYDRPCCGAIVTGKIFSGSVREGDNVVVSGNGIDKNCKVLSIERDYVRINSAGYGEYVGLLLEGISKKEIKSGFKVHKGSYKQWRQIKANIYILKREEGGRHTPFQSYYRPQLYIEGAKVTCQIVLPGNIEFAMPGDNVEVGIDLLYPLVLNNGDRFTLREGGRTIASGYVTKTIF